MRGAEDSGEGRRMSYISSLKSNRCFSVISSVEPILPKGTTAQVAFWRKSNDKFTIIVYLIFQSNIATWVLFVNGFEAKIVKLSFPSFGKVTKNAPVRNMESIGLSDESPVAFNSKKHIGTKTWKELWVIFNSQKDRFYLVVEAKKLNTDEYMGQILYVQQI